ncbi:MAG: hypothetical protein A2787_09375 [Omnitrophica WOR_2 bacterium RIFCSPHIGHO2_01_FULL_48_9]|nr:MAG: hypothetical protein A3D10_03445 [Omnitrophica WOR_2 bacterium RIFCSPHIGHO2_02_FULL_48_11]OGX30901.1 MAG: hypothetical protein A2787_09375 [Omnitrophica WOR_2 bacterium RIFCSPHIGHO2_01_FULL_48_9]
MYKSIQVSASILCADFTKLGAEIKKCEDAGVDILHVDVMDGHFVPNISIGLPIVEAIRPLTKLPIDTHLMIDNPGVYVEPFAKAGADIISIHVECYGVPAIKRAPDDFSPWTVNKIDAGRMREDLKKIRNLGKKAYAVVNPATPLCIDEILQDIDGVLIMSVNPGYARQKFMPEVLPKICELRQRFAGDIALDGGVNGETAPEAVKAGVNILATASYFFGSKNPHETVRQLKNLSR